MKLGINDSSNDNQKTAHKKTHLPSEIKILIKKYCFKSKSVYPWLTKLFSTLNVRGNKEVINLTEAGRAFFTEIRYTINHTDPLIIMCTGTIIKESLSG